MHGGQVWYTGHPVIEDLSVTVNPLGVPSSCLDVLRATLSTAERYPPLDWEPARGSLFKFLGLERQRQASVSQLLLGNGASELIDTVIRYLCASGARSFTIGPDAIQYKEYEKTAIRCGMRIARSRGEADVHFLVNPNNPTGSFLSHHEFLSYITHWCNKKSAVVVDESMLPWLGPDWTTESLLSDVTRIGDLERDFEISVFVIHSWTKLWSCCGLRIGSVWCPSVYSASRVVSLLVPWNVNVLALAFLQAAVTDSDYLLKTWRETPRWRSRFIARLRQIGPEWQAYGEDWLPWIWLDVLKPEVASEFTMASAESGLPVRPGAMGYGQSSFVRVRVCMPEHQDLLCQAIRNHSNIV